MIVYGQRVVNFVDRINGGTPDPVAVGIGWEVNGELSAGVKFDHYNGASIAMHVAAVEGKRWMRKEYLHESFRYPFVQLGVKKILGFVSEGNLTAQRFDEHLGFVLEARIAKACPDGDLLIYTMTPDQCRFLGKTYGK